MLTPHISYLLKTKPLEEYTPFTLSISQKTDTLSIPSNISIKLAIIAKNPKNFKKHAALISALKTYTVHGIR